MSLVQHKIPFDPDLFFGAVTNLMGVEPDTHTGHAGFHDVIWILPKARGRICTSTIITWMNYFDIIAGASRCDIAYWEGIALDENNKPRLVLRVTIKHNVVEKTE